MIYTFTSTIPFPNSDTLVPKDGAIKMDGTIQMKIILNVNTSWEDDRIDSVRATIESRIAKLFNGATLELASKE